MDKKIEEALSRLKHATEQIISFSRKTEYQVEIYGLYSLNETISMDQSRIDGFFHKNDQGIGIRAVNKRKMGFSHTDKLDTHSLEQAFFDAIGFCKVSEEFPGLETGLESYGVTTPNLDFFDKVILDSDIESKSKHFNQIKEAVNEKSKDQIHITGEISSSITALSISSSEGTFKQGISSVYSYFIQAWQQYGEKFAAAYDYNLFTNNSLFKPVEVGHKLSKTVKSQLNPTEISTKLRDIILSPESSFSLLNSVATASAAHLWLRDQTYFRGRMDKMIASPSLTLYDNGLLKKGMTFSFDDEGAPRKKTRIVKEGVLTNLLTDRYSANLLKIPNTGNASRAGYSSLPTIKETNLELDWSGEKMKREELISETKDGLLVEIGGVDIDIVSGEVSGIIDTGYLIENGEIVSPIRNATIGKFGFQLLTNISAITKEREMVAGDSLPWLKIEKIKTKSENH
ncbi:MAG: TldD/PmbA family protein [Candidatus Kariarchaeaceae archaeon]